MKDLHKHDKSYLFLPFYKKTLVLILKLVLDI